MSEAALFWTFNAGVVLLLTLDLGFFHRGDGVMSLRHALAWSAFWVALAMGFAGLLFFWRGNQAALQFVTGYVIEGSLSLDNLFVFLAIFSFFRVPRESQYKVLFWGIAGALVTRAAFIFAGVALMNHFGAVVEYVFGFFLVYTGFRLLRGGKRAMHPETNPVLKLARRFLPFSSNYEGGRFFVRKEGRFAATPLLLVLLIVESTDIAFATDSIPAILAITRDVVIVYTSNVFAVLGLRAIFFVLSGAIERFTLLKYGLSAILVFIGGKMLATRFVEIPILPTLGVVGGILTTSIVASMIMTRSNRQPGSPDQVS